jgi:hypothetical protein
MRKMGVKTESIDRLFLELSHFTSARTEKEIKLARFVLRLVERERLTQLSQLSIDAIHYLQEIGMDG